jgi:hypothetical protein
VPGCVALFFVGVVRRALASDGVRLGHCVGLVFSSSHNEIRHIDVKYNSLTQRDTAVGTLVCST